MRFGIVGARESRPAAAVPRRIEAGPGLDAGIVRVHGDGVEDPLAFAGFGIEGLEEARRIHIVAGADDHVIAEHDGRDGREVLLVEAGDLLLPFFFAGSGIEADQVIVVDLEIEVVVPHAHAAVAGVVPPRVFQ